MDPGEERKDNSPILHTLHYESILGLAIYCYSIEEILSITRPIDTGESQVVEHNKAGMGASPPVHSDDIESVVDHPN